MMAKYHFDPGLVFCLLLLFVNLSTALRIVKCDSNMISTVEYDNDLNKAVITFDENNHIKVTHNHSAYGKFSLYCETDTIFEKCSLKHESTSAAKCEFSIPQPCNNINECKDKTITYGFDGWKNCSFTLTQISPNGK